MESQLNGRSPDFDPEVHPDIIFRMALMGFSMQTIAEVVGIPAVMLDEWASHHPEVEDAFSKARRADSEVYHTLYCLALGIDPLTGNHTKNGPDRAACLAWLKARKVIVEEPKRPPGAPAGTLPEVLSLIRDAERMLTAGADASVRTPKVIDANDPEPPAGF